MIKRSASSRKDLKISIPFARVWVILQCLNIKLHKTKDYWTRDYVFDENWSRKTCLTCIFVQTYRKFCKFKKKLAMKFEPAQIVRKSTQVIASWW